MKDAPEEPDNAAEVVTHNDGENFTQNERDLTHILQSQSEEVARLTAESAAKDERIGDLLAQIERLDGAHRGHLDDLRALHAAERDRMTAAHGDTVPTSGPRSGTCGETSPRPASRGSGASSGGSAPAVTLCQPHPRQRAELPATDRHGEGTPRDRPLDPQKMPQHGRVRDPGGTGPPAPSRP